MAAAIGHSTKISLTLEKGKIKKVHIRGIRPDYATIVPFVSDNEILAIKSYQHLVDTVQIEVPSSYLENAETPEQAAVRELEEETGYKAEEVLYVGSYFGLFHV